MIWNYPLSGIYFQVYGSYPSLTWRKLVLKVVRLPLAVYRPSQRSTYGERTRAEADATPCRDRSAVILSLVVILVKRSQCGAGTMPRVRRFTRRSQGWERLLSLAPGMERADAMQMKHGPLPKLSATFSFQLNTRFSSFIFHQGPKPCRFLKLFS